MQTRFRPAVHSLARLNFTRLTLVRLSAGPVLYALCAGAQAGPAAVATGNYECWGNGQARMMLNLKVAGRDRYTDPDGREKGRFSYSEGSGLVEFKGGHLDGALPKGFTVVYHEPKGRPTFSFRSGRGAEASFCERVGK